MPAQIPRLPECITTFIAGPVASGKTWLIKKLVNQVERSLILDAGADYLSDDYEHIWKEPNKLAKRLEKNPYYYRIAYHPDTEFFDEEFRWNFAAIWAVDKPRLFVIEEAHKVCAVNALHPCAETTLRFARHNYLGVIASSQRIADVDKLLTQSARMVILFWTPEIRDVEATAQRWGSDMARDLQKLRPCIYDDASHVCEQEPQAIIYIKGYGYRIIELGSKIKAENTEDIWQEQLQEPAEKQEHPSLEQDSGNPEESSPDSSLEAS